MLSIILDVEKLCIVVPLRDNQLKPMRCFKAYDFEFSRFDPSVPMIIPSYVSKGGIGLYGMHTPAGTESWQPHVIQRNTEIFGEDADAFRSERWLEDDARAELMGKGILTSGYRNGIYLGKNIALMETYKRMSQVYNKYNAPSVASANNCR